MAATEGLEAIRQMRTFDSGLKIIATSGSGNAETCLKTAEMLGFDAVLDKPQ